MFLILYGTGLKGRSDLAALRASIGGVSSQILYAGPSSLLGLDQVNLSLPRIMMGRGLVDIVISGDGKMANTVQVSVGPVTASAMQ